MPRYDYKCCTVWEQFSDYDSRDSVKCCDCGKLASRLVSLFAIHNATHIGAKRFAGIEKATGVTGIECVKDASKALEQAGVTPVDAYFRQKPLPKRQEVTDEDFMKYL